MSLFFLGTWECQDSREFVVQDLRKWTAEFNVPLTALKGIIKIMNSRLSANLSADPRTIMKTPRSINVIQIGGTGEYWHQGLGFCLLNCFRNITQNLSISINVNIDGLPIYRSSPKNFWPVLFNVQEYPNIRPMAIGIFYGHSKPENVQQYLTPFIDEMLPILKHGLQLNGFKLLVRVRCFICDSPARAFLKGSCILLYM